MSFLARIIFAFRQAAAHRQELKVYREHQHQRASLIQLSMEEVIDPAIKCMVLDFDGVMASHGKLVPHPDVVEWLNEVERVGALSKLAILSNKPLAARAAYFKANYPDIEFIYAKAKKPYPDGLRQVIEARHLAPNEVLLIDDRLLTGMLACVLAGTRGLWIVAPYQDFRLAFVQECFFAGLRALEKIWLACLR